jgi:hypothetical protein
MSDTKNTKRECFFLTTWDRDWKIIAEKKWDVTPVNFIIKPKKDSSSIHDGSYHDSYYIERENIRSSKEYIVRYILTNKSLAEHVCELHAESELYVFQNDEGVYQGSTMYDTVYELEIMSKFGKFSILPQDECIVVECPLQEDCFAKG